jgi:hypothetical protein
MKDEFLPRGSMGGKKEVGGSLRDKDACHEYVIPVAHIKSTHFG